MKVPATLLFMYLLLSACTTKKPAVSTTGYFVHIDRCELTDTTSSLYLKDAHKDVILLHCSTNLPVNTRILVHKGLAHNTTVPGVDIYNFADTVLVTRENMQFVTTYQPYFVGCGYLNYCVYQDMQADSISRKFKPVAYPHDEPLFYSAYNISYVGKQSGHSCFVIPDIPVRLKITPEMAP